MCSCQYLQRILCEVNNVSERDNAYPEVLKSVMPPPKQLFVAGETFSELMAKPRITVIGSRRATPYGKAVATQLALELAKAGVVIISGLALGIDSIAHRAALEADTPTIAVLPCGLERMYPASHASLARQIVQQGGALVTEYPPDTRVQKWSFLERNRIASGLGQGVLIIEAAERSGTLNTTRYALEQGKDVFAVPGNITSSTSVGTNNLIKAGAIPVTDVSDVLHRLGITPAATKHITSDIPEEQAIIVSATIWYHRWVQSYLHAPN